MIGLERPGKTESGSNLVAAATAGGVAAPPVPRTGKPGLIGAQSDSTVGYSAEAVVPTHLLDGGEVVVFAIKPSPWFVFFRSFRWLIGLTLVALIGSMVGEGFVGADTLIQTVAAAAALVVGVTLLQWVSRLYVLTNRRMMRFRGVLSVEILETPLVKIDEVTLSVAPYERPTRLGTLYFETPDDATGPVCWFHVARPQEVHREVSDAIRRAKNSTAHRDL